VEKRQRQSGAKGMKSRAAWELGVGPDGPSRCRRLRRHPLDPALAERSAEMARRSRAATRGASGGPSCRRQNAYLTREGGLWLCGRGRGTRRARPGSGLGRLARHKTLKRRKSKWQAKRDESRSPEAEPRSLDSTRESRPTRGLFSERDVCVSASLTKMRVAFSRSARLTLRAAHIEHVGIQWTPSPTPHGRVSHPEAD